MKYGMDEPRRPDPLAPPDGYGSKPGQAEAEPETDSDLCVHGRCDMLALWRMFTGCPAEHIARLNLCTVHAIEHWYAKYLTCAIDGQEVKIIKVEDMHGLGDFTEVIGSIVGRAMSRIGLPGS